MITPNADEAASPMASGTPEVQIGRTHQHDNREVTADVTDAPPLLTAAGKRPIDPFKVTISFHIGTDRVYVEIAGRKLFKDNPLARFEQTVTRRRYTQDDALPSWVTALIDEHRPIESREGWWH